MKKQKPPIYHSAGASFDASRAYRYHLHRYWVQDPNPRVVLWILLNPSTADESKLDPTLRRCQGFSRAWDFEGFEVCNIFAYRSTKPKPLYRLSDPEGPDNERLILEHVERVRENGGIVVAGWGRHGALHDVGERYRKLLWPHANCLGTTKDGQPLHPLYLPGDSTLRLLSRRSVGVD